MNKIYSLAKRWSLLRFVCADLCITALIMILLNMGNQIQAWNMFEAMNYTFGQKVLVIAFTWLSSSFFWSWMLISGLLATFVWKKANATDAQERSQEGREENKCKDFSIIKIWYGLLGIMPAYGAYQANQRYRYIDGIYQKIPATFQDYVEGFVSGLLVAGILFGISKIVGKIYSKLKK